MRVGGPASRTPERGAERRAAFFRPLRPLRRVKTPRGRGTRLPGVAARAAGGAAGVCPSCARGPGSAKLSAEARGQRRGAATPGRPGLGHSAGPRARVPGARLVPRSWASARAARVGRGRGAAGAAGDLARLLGAPLPGRCGPHAPAAGRPRPGTSGARGASGRRSKGGLRGGGARRGPDSCRGGGRGAPRRPAPPSRPPFSRSLQPIRRAPRAGGVGLPIKRRGAVTPRAGCAAPGPEPASQTRGV